jgi:tRNA (adenine57-N1/adenine58-N1)-methyltransferase catalytic subunit
MNIKKEYKEYKVLYQLGKKERIESLDKEICLVKDKTFFIKDLNQPFHTQHGFITKEDLNKPSGSLIKSSKGTDFIINDANFFDKYHKIKRGAAVIPPKDIGVIISTVGLNKNSIVVDAGAGSGAMCCFLAGIAKHVTSYDVRDDHFDIVKGNIEFLGLDNLTLKKGNIYEKIDEEDIDFLNLDVPEPWFVIPQAKKCLKVGGFISVYNPTLPQISDFVEELKKEDSFYLVKVVEIIEREWEVNKRKIRPKTQQKISHSGFLAFARKIK